MSKGIFITAGEVAQELGISRPHAYKVIKGWNEELKTKGYFVIAGKISRKYYMEKIYGSRGKEDKVASI